ncbi:hypothetical protein [Pseudomonas sp. FP1740]|uniref:hypothetical protein n=1 Tax=Pseudomonas sp. FP1740 TaxID=2954078 RepID=UPI0027366BB3|nr:hypothetical protein [Pseudomonas sp. FP1740]WLG46410.1 hypothetical protein PSH69_07280 [Pseudomonas sp. FP1740]
MKFQNFAAVVAIVFSVSGCASKESIVRSTLASATVGEGVIYSLPKQLVKVSYSRELLDSTKTAENLKVAKEGVDAAKKAVKDITAEEKAITQLISSLDPLSPEKAATETKLNIELTVVKAKKLNLSNKLQELVDAFKVAQLEHASTLQDSHAFSEKFEITAQPATTEGKQTFSAITNHGGAFSDTLEIKTKGGLLDGAIGQSDDKTGEVITTLTSTLAGVFGVPGGSQFRAFALKRPLAEAITCDPKLVASVNQIVDPFDVDDMEVLNNALKQAACIQLSAKRDEAVNSLSGQQVFNGLVYRQPGVVDFTVSKSSGGEVLQRIPLTLAQGGHIGVVSMPKGRFSKNEYDIAFSNGALTKSRIIQPSEAMGVAMIIPNAIKGVFALPTELIKLKVDYSTNEKSLAEIKKAMIDAQVEIEKKQIELDALKKSESE